MRIENKLFMAQPMKNTKLGLDMSSPCYRDDMSETERNLPFEQERALLLDGSLTMKDPYALASY